MNHVTSLLVFLLWRIIDNSAESYFHILSPGQTLYVNLGETISVNCEFYTEEFNLFDNPIIWRKQQLDEESQMNMMGNLIAPYSSVKRFKVTFHARAPRYYFGLVITDTEAEDCANYTCEVNGPHNILLGHVTHNVYVRESWQLPTPELSVFVGRRDVTAELRAWSSCTLSGKKSLRLINCTSVRWSDRFEALAEDDGKTARCVVRPNQHLSPSSSTSSSSSSSSLPSDFLSLPSSLSSSSLPSSSSNGDEAAAKIENYTSANIVVSYAPVIECFPSFSFLGERNAWLRCEVRARPWVTSLYWILDLNGTTISNGEYVSEYWTMVMDRTDGVLETQLFLRQTSMDSFRSYSLVAENVIGERRQQAVLKQKFRSRPGDKQYDEGVRYVQRDSRVQLGDASSSSSSSSSADRDTRSYRSGCTSLWNTYLKGVRSLTILSAVTLNTLTLTESLRGVSRLVDMVIHFSIVIAVSAVVDLVQYSTR